MRPDAFERLRGIHVFEQLGQTIEWLISVPTSVPAKACCDIECRDALRETRRNGYLEIDEVA